MALNTHGSYVITGEATADFNRDYGSYLAYRNSLIKISEHAELFLKELRGTISASDLKPHFDGQNSFAIGYGIDLLVRDRAEINTYLQQAQRDAISDADAGILDSARALRTYYAQHPQVNSHGEPLVDNVALLNAHFNQLSGAINAQGGNVVFAAGSSLEDKFKTLMRYYCGRLELELGSIDDANEMLDYHLQRAFENGIDVSVLPESKERAAVLSTLFQIPNSPILRGLVSGAVQDSDENTRAKIWLEIRYFTNNDRARRNRESDAFGLFDTATGAFGGNEDEALKTADYFFRGRRYNSAGVASDLYSSIQQMSSSLRADFKQSIKPALDHLSAIYADGNKLDAAYVLGEDEASLDASELASSGADLIRGNTGGNLLRGGDKGDIIYGLAGNDTIYGDNGSDTLYGGDGNDTIYGGADGDTLKGGGQ